MEFKKTISVKYYGGELIQGTPHKIEFTHIKNTGINWDKKTEDEKEVFIIGLTDNIFTFLLEYFFMVFGNIIFFMADAIHDYRISRGYNAKSINKLQFVAKYTKEEKKNMAVIIDKYDTYTKVQEKILDNKNFGFHISKRLAYELLDLRSKYTA